MPLLLGGGAVFATINPNNYSYTWSMQNKDQIIDVFPYDMPDQYVSTKRTIQISTNAPSGYKIFVGVDSNESSQGSLILSGGSSSIPSIIPINTTPSTASTLGVNSWGFGIPSGTTGLPPNIFSSTYTAGFPNASNVYAGVKVEPTYTLIRNVTSAVSGTDSLDIYYGVRLGDDIIANPGAYQTNLTYHALIEATNVVGGEATISPTSGTRAGNETVTITTSMMTDFVPSDISVTIGDTPCTSPTGSNSTGVLVITCTTGAHRPATTDVVVNVNSLGQSYTIADGYEYIETGEIKLTSITYVSGINVSGTPNPSIDATTGEIDFDLTFLGGLDNTDTLQATYRLTITNTTGDDFVFTAPDSNMRLRISANEVRDITYELSGIAVGDTIPSGTSKTFDIILSTDYVSGEHGTEGGVNVEPINQADPIIIGSINGSNAGDLSGSNTLTPFQINVESTFNESKSFTINSLSPDFMVVNSSGNALGSQTIAANTTGTYTFYLKKASGAAFASETATAGITINYDSTYVNVGEVHITVDKDPAFVDSQAPTISNVTIEKNKTVTGEATLTWSGTDNVGVRSYDIYKCTTSSCDNPISVNGTTNSYTFTNLQANTTYYFVVAGHDDAGNTADQISNATTNPGPASKTVDTTFTWTYNVTASITYGSISHTSGTSITAGGTYQGKITPNSNTFTTTYSLPNTITVVMDDRTLDASEYTYTSTGTNAGNVRVDNVSGDIQITAVIDTSACLIEGTLITLADGTTKPVEEVTYQDELKVWDYSNGAAGTEYPAWIEKTRPGSYHQLTKFSDGSELKTYGWHGVFDVDNNEFISVDDPTRFYPGVRIYKVQDDELVPVTVVSTERVEGIINIYHVVSRQYYNVIANDVLTTDGTVMLSNLYGFDENIKWPILRDQVISDPNNLYTYADFVDIGLPERMFNELRVAEAKYLYTRYGITLEQFKIYLLGNQLNPDMWLPYNDE